MPNDYHYCRSCNTHVTRYGHGNDCEVGDVGDSHSESSVTADSDDSADVVRLRDGHVVEVLGDVEAPVRTDHLVGDGT